MVNFEFDGKDNSHFFQKPVFIEGIGDSPRKLVVIQVPEIVKKTIAYELKKPYMPA